MALFLSTLLVGNQFIARDRAVTNQMLGHDFLAFYTGGSFLRQGRYHDLYKLDAVRDFEQATARSANLEVGKSFGPWWNPPFYALLFEPMAAYPYPVALNIWRCINLGALALAITLLVSVVAIPKNSEIPGARDPRNWALVPLLMLVSMPAIQSFSHGQNTFTSLLLLSATVVAWRADRKLIAGLIAGLLFFKPQLGAVITLALAVDLGWPAVAGLATTGLNLVCLTMILLPGSLRDFFRMLPANVKWMQVDHAYLWERHVTLKAFWRLLLQGREAGEALVLPRVLTYITFALVAGALARATIIARRHNRFSPDPVRRDRIIAATITAMPLLMPFYFDYDLMLLAIPATLYAAERLQRPELASAGDRWLTRAWVALFLWLFVNPAVALHTHLNVTILLLSGIASLQIARATRKEEVALQPLQQQWTEYSLAA